MGLIKAAFGSAGGVLADQWKEMIYCDSLPADVLVRKGQKRNNDRTSNTQGDDNIITNGSAVIVNDGQCMVIVEQGKVVDFCAEPGEFTYDTSLAPSVFAGSLGTGILDTFKNIGKRFTFGGDTGVDQRVYYFNTKEIVGNKYGTPNPVPFRVVDQNIGLDIDISVRCNGEFSYKICDPLLFYQNVCGNVEADYDRSQIASQLRTELLTALQPAFAKISAMGVRYSAVPAHTTELADVLNEQLSNKWSGLRGIKIVSFGVSAIAADEEDEALIKQMQKSAVMRDPRMAAAVLTGAQAEAMVGAANNENAGAFMGFAGMGMAMNVGGANPASLYQAAGAQQGQPQPSAYGADANGGFPGGMQGQPGVGQQGVGQQGVGQAGQQAQQAAPMAQAAAGGAAAGAGVAVGVGAATQSAPSAAAAEGWVCSSCGTVNKGKFCHECGSSKPEGAPLYRCDKCGWEPADPHNPPKFCPECGDPFDENDKA